MTLAAIAGGAASLVAVVIANQSSAQETADRVNGLESTTVLATMPGTAWAIDEGTVVKRASSVRGLRSIGTLSLPNAGTFDVSIGRTGSDEPAARASTVVATAGGLTARHANITEGALTSPAAEARDARQVLLGVALARQLGVDNRTGSNRVTVNGFVMTVTGLVKDGGDNAVLSTAVVLTPRSARYLGILPESRLVIADVEEGTASEVARVLPAFIDAPHGREISLSVPPSPAKLREQLLAGTRSLVLVIACVMSAATVFSIVTTMQIAAWERRREVGLNLALGSRRADIAVRFLTESMLLGLIGAVAGFLAGVLTGATVSSLSGWDLQVPLWTLLVPPAGAVAGALAGALPAWNASKVDPAELLRST